MATPHPRGRPKTLEELLVVQRASGPAPCAHCDGHDDHHALVESALRARVRVLEHRVAELESSLCELS